MEVGEGEINYVLPLEAQLFRLLTICISHFWKLIAFLKQKIEVVNVFYSLFLKFYTMDCLGKK